MSLFLGRTKGGLPGLQPWGLEGRILSELGRGFRGGGLSFLVQADVGGGVSPGLGGHLLREPWGGAPEGLGSRWPQDSSVCIWHLGLQSVTKWPTGQAWGKLGSS